MSGQTPYSYHSQQGANSGTSSGYSYASSQDARTSQGQSAASLQPPSPAHLCYSRQGANYPSPAHTQASSTAVYEGVVNGSSSRYDATAYAKDTSSAYYNHDDKKTSAGGSGADDKTASGSIWERKASQISGGNGATSRERTALPDWLRDP